MQFRSLLLVSALALAVVACTKTSSDTSEANPDPTTPTNPETPTNPTTPARNYFKLKTIKYRALSGSQVANNNTTSISIDSTNNKITLNKYDSLTSIRIIETYTYNDNNQLTLFESSRSNNVFYISRMEFVRNNNGELTSVNSTYKNGLVATSTGTVKYEKKQDTTFITFSDATQKVADDGTSANDYTITAIVNNKIVYRKTDISNHSDYTFYSYGYDVTGNLTDITAGTSKAANGTTYYLRGTRAATEIQKYISFMGGGIPWFTRVGISAGWDLSSYPQFAGNTLESIVAQNITSLAFTNEYDVNGNLVKATSYTPGAPAPAFIVTSSYEYR